LIGQVILPAFLAAAALLILAGVAKLAAPTAASQFLRAYAVPNPRLVVRIGASVELLVGVAAFLQPRLAGLGIGLLYGLFAILVATQLRRRQTESCGCFGRADIAPSYVHLGLNLLCMTTAFVAVAAGPPAWDTLAGVDPLAAAVVVLASGVVAVMAQTAVVLLPSTMNAWGGAGRG
jgi:hypothetical protein